jgi:signal transduction histidine kinase
VVNQLRHYAESKEIRLEAELDSAMGACPGDLDRLTQVINNLVNNAIKFSPRGASVIARTLRRDGTARVEVADSGPGIAPDEIPLLFNEFTRLKNRPTGGEKSSGVGLAISRYLMNAHGGNIGVDSTVGKGTTFWFEIPC